MKAHKVAGGFFGGLLFFLAGILGSIIMTILSAAFTSLSILLILSIIYATLSFFGVVPVVDYLPGVPYL